MKETLMKFLTWLSASATVASILHLIPILFGAIGAVLWCLVAFYKFIEARNEYKISALKLQALEHKAKSVNITQAVSSSCQHDN